jgi:Fic family protein
MLYTFFRPSTVTNSLLRELDEARAALDPYAGLTDKFTGELKRHILIQTVHYSTQIEGNILTYEQVKGVLAGEKINAPPEQIQEVQNYREAISYIQSLVQRQQPHISEETILTIHYLVTKNLPGQYSPGRYRQVQNFVVDRISNKRVFFPPVPGKVPLLIMTEFVDWLNRPDDLAMTYKAALAHLNLVAIHPFIDGNGRTARIIDSLVMYRGGFLSQELVSLEAYFGRDTQGYYNALSAALGPNFSPPKVVTPWIDYYLQAHVNQAKEALSEVQGMEAEMELLQQATKQEELSQWQLTALWIVLRRGSITNRAYRNVTARSNISAWADFKLLMDKEWIDCVGRGRSVAYVPSKKAANIFELIRQKLADRR